MTGIDVSRETIQDLEEYCAEVLKWNKAINLISRSTINEIWNRHIVDSLQLYSVSGDFKHWIDLGSGGGFPGIVCAIAAKFQAPDSKFTLVESDARKSAFLLQMSLKFDLNMTVLPQRIENCNAGPGDLVSARALAPLSDLLNHAEDLLQNGGMCLFPKGKSHESEVLQAQKQWSFECDVLDSSTSADAAILRIRNVCRKY